MKNQDQFLRAHRKPPRKGFAKSLFQRLSQQRTPTALLVWGLVGMLLAVSLSSNRFYANLFTPYATQTAEAVNVLVMQHDPNPALLAEQGLKTAAVKFPFPEVERLGPFDMPKHVETRVENEHYVMVVITVAERR